MDTVDVIVVVFIAIDTIMKLRDWVITFLDSKKDITDDSLVQMTRGDLRKLRAFFDVLPKDLTSDHAEILTWCIRIATKCRLILTKIAPEELRKFDDELVVQWQSVRK